MKREGQQNLNHFFRGLMHYNVSQAWVCPGSRNAPLIHGAVAAGMQLFSVVDERSAAYKALGAALVLDKPVVLICTSGTAVLNFFPALAEAHFLRVPLIVLTADRPESMQDRWENQTIYQERIFGSYSNAFIQWKGILEQKRSLGKVERMVQKIYNNTHLPASGPVHVNFRFTEPLYYNPIEIKPTHIFSLEKTIRALHPKQHSAKLTHTPQGALVLCMSDRNPNPFVLQSILALKAAGVPIWADLLSPFRHLSDFPYWELMLMNLTETQWKSIQPHTLITTGRLLLNKKIKNLIRKHPPTQHIHISSGGPVKDPFFTRPKVTTWQTDWELAKQSEYNARMQACYEACEPQTKLARSRDLGLGDLYAIYQTLQCLPKDSVLHVSSSMAVRYVALCVPDNSVTVYSNRGTSGIDGSISTAVGAALADPNRVHTIIAGDLSFLYDSNALWSDPMPNNLRIVVLNNGGGNIFDLISGPEISPALRYFTTPHTRNASDLAKIYGINTCMAVNESELHEGLSKLFDQNTLQLLEIKTQPNLNKTIWNQLKM